MCGWLEYVKYSFLSTLFSLFPTPHITILVLPPICGAKAVSAVLHLIAMGNKIFGRYSSLRALCMWRSVGKWKVYDSFCIFSFEKRAWITLVIINPHCDGWMETVSVITFEYLGSL